MEAARANRSDIHVSKEEEVRMEEETRKHFDELAPKRHTKPLRSEHSSQYVDANSNAHIIPEYFVFQHLETDQHKLEGKNRGEESEEFVETDYYTDLNRVNKQHHTTGTGFIKTENGDNNYRIVPESDVVHHASCKGNPATNDWIPSAENQERELSKAYGSLHDLFFHDGDSLNVGVD